MRRLFLGALVLLILLPLSASAAGEAANVTVEGGVIGNAYSIDIMYPPCAWSMSYGMNELCSPPGFAANPPITPLIVTAHATLGVPFSVTVSDKLNWGKPAASKGKMAQWNFCWTYTEIPPPPPPAPWACPPGGPGILGNCSIVKNQWMPSGKVLTKPLHLNETICLAPPCPPGFTFRNYNMTGTDPVLFTGIGDTIPGGPPGPGVSRMYSVRQQITMDDVALRYDTPIPLPPGSLQIGYVQQNSYKMPLTFTLTTL